jgi:site-specific DNA-methyltransferase (adenine-specific)
MNKIIFGNSVNVLKTLEGGIVDLTVTSPPYDNLRTYNGKVKENITYEDGFSFPFVEMVRELYRVTKLGGVVVWVVNDQVIKGGESGNSFRQALGFMNVGFLLHDTMIYEKNSSSYPASAKSNRYTQIFEYMFVFSKGKPKTSNLICDKPNKWAGHTNWGKNTKRIGENEQLVEVGDIKPVPNFSPRNNIWRYVNGGGFASKDKIAHKHPAIFPEELVRDHINTWTNKGDLIYDPFIGSGTVAKMCILMNRDYIGSEISQEYVDICNERIKITLDSLES